MKFIKDSDKDLAKNIAIVAIDSLVNTVDLTYGSGLPFASGAWGLAKALIGNGIARREKKAIEWVKMIQDNPAIFTKNLVTSEEFQDAFVVSLEGYLKERNAVRRKVLAEIFKNYSSSRNTEAYPLERYNEITRQLTEFDAEVFVDIRKQSLEQKPGAAFRPTVGTSDKIESMFHLISLGLLMQDPSPRLGETQVPFVFVSSLGSLYCEFIEASRNE